MKPTKAMKAMKAMKAKFCSPTSSLEAEDLVRITLIQKESALHLSS
jgi:hypothetical protein